MPILILRKDDSDLLLHCIRQILDETKPNDHNLDLIARLHALKEKLTK